MTNESCTRREGIEGDLVAKRRKRDRRNWEGRKNTRTADGSEDEGLRRMDGIGQIGQGLEQLKVGWLDLRLNGF
jgi:hypothetical protein